MKSCLKLPSLPPTPNTHCCPRKCVAFCAEGSEQVFPADDWDRTPAEPAHKLTYSDILELKEIQRSLPSAPQTPDPLCQRPQAQLLKKVPIGLLPLLPETYSCGNDPPSPRSPPSSTSSPTSSFAMTFKARPQLSPWRPMQNPQTVATNSSRPRTKFAFLPLLDTPPPSYDPSPVSSPPASPRTFAEFEASLELGNDVLHHVPPTPTLTNASLDSPPSRASTPSPDPFDRFRLPPRAISPSAESPFSTEESGSYFPPFSPPSITLPNSRHNEESIEDYRLEPKTLKLQALSSPDGTPSPLALTPSIALSQPSGRPTQTYTQLHGSTQGRSLRTPSIGVREANEMAGEHAHAAELSPYSSSRPPALNHKQGSLPPIPPSLPASERTSRPKWKAENVTPFFAFERSANFSRPTSPPSTKVTSPTRSRDLQPPSPILAPYCVSMRGRSSPCSSPVIVPLSQGRSGDLRIQ